DATTSDGLATAVAVLGAEKGLRLVDDTTASAAVVMEPDDSGVHSYESSRWRALRNFPVDDQAGFACKNGHNFKEDCARRAAHGVQGSRLRSRSTRASYAEAAALRSRRGQA